MVFRILPQDLRAKANSGGPCGNRALPENMANVSDNPTRSRFRESNEEETSPEIRVL